ncbi:MAG: hypothetical protein HUU50_09285 [Candidatus Brocadiae bacterium]|nr:hypothetical protein [Candidatus Brocadiia bacterium]
MENQPFEIEELQRALDTGNIHHSLNNDNIKKAAHIIFGDKDRITQDFYQNTIVAGNYIGFDLERHGFPNLLADMKLLIKNNDFFTPYGSHISA